MNNQIPKRNWREILANIGKTPATDKKLKPNPDPKTIIVAAYYDPENDPGILGDEAFELEREKQAMMLHCWPPG